MKLLSLTFICTFYCGWLAAQVLSWAGRTGGTSHQNAFQVAIDHDDHVVACGFFEESGDFDPGTGTAILTSVGDADVYVMRVTPGGTLDWARRFGGGTEDYAEAVAVDESNHIYVAGYFNGTSDFDPGPGTANLTAAGSYDAYVVKFDSEGQFLWARRFGGPDLDQARSVVIDTSGHVIVGGRFNDTGDFNPGAGTANLTSEGGNDIFLVKLDADGNFIWARGIGGPGDDQSRGLAIDTANHIISTGRFSSAVDFDPGSGEAEMTSAGNSDAYILRLTPAGMYHWAVRFGSTETDEGNAVHADEHGFIYTVGFFAGTADFNPGPGTLNFTSAGGDDIFISKLDLDGEHSMALRFGGSGLDKSHAITTDDAGHIYTSGYFSETSDFDPGPGEYELTSGGLLDGFISKISPDGAYVWAGHWPGPEDSRFQGLALTSSQTIVAQGYFSGSVDLDPGDSDLLVTSAGQTDGFLVALSQCQTTSSVLNETVCGSFFAPNGEQLTESGTYVISVTNAEGCDSIITIHLVVLSESNAEIVVSACGSYTSPSGEEVWTESGSYLDTLVNAMGCDSVISIQLTILQPSAGETSITVCDIYTTPNGKPITESGIYEFVLENAAGCDSILTVNLTVKNSTVVVITPEACDRYTSPSGLFTWAESGVYQDIIPNAAGCDSVMVIELTILPSTTGQLKASACGSFLSPSLNYQWTASGTYLDTILNGSGCDSVITIDLTIIDINTEVVQADEVLTSLMDGASYQWIDCDSGFQPLEGQTGQQFVASANGHYAVIVYSGGCSDTSECFAVTTVGIEGLPIVHPLKIYPNPSSGPFVLDPGWPQEEGQVIISDLQGREIYRNHYAGDHPIHVRFFCPAGVYFVSLTNQYARWAGKIIIQN